MQKNKYLKDGRLEDVLALLQVLALDEDSHRSEAGLASELGDSPDSADTWSEIAKEHREFFRVVESKQFPVSLVARHVSEESGQKRPALSAENTQALLNSAVEIHDRQIRRSQRWTVLIPVWVAVIGAVVTMIKLFFENGA